MKIARIEKILEHAQGILYKEVLDELARATQKIRHLEAENAQLLKDLGPKIQKLADAYAGMCSEVVLTF